MIPNAFSPNEDGANDVFRAIAYGGTIVEFNMIIYNRWGTKVFKSSDIQQGWDGVFKGDVQPLDVYVYAVEYRFEGKMLKQLSGNVTLVH